MESTDKTFGLQVLFDLRVEPHERLNEGTFWRTLLVDLVAMLGVRPLSKPDIHPSVCSNPRWEPADATGISGGIVLAESHLYFHSFREAGYVFFDVFSCKAYDPLKVWQFLDHQLHIKHGNWHEAPRGANFPFSE